MVNIAPLSVPFEQHRHQLWLERASKKALDFVGQHDGATTGVTCGGVTKRNPFIVMVRTKPRNTAFNSPSARDVTTTWRVLGN